MDYFSRYFSHVESVVCTTIGALDRWTANRLTLGAPCAAYCGRQFVDESQRVGVLVFGQSRSERIVCQCCAAKIAAIIAR